MSERSVFRRRASLATTEAAAALDVADVASDAVEILRSELRQLRLTELLGRAASARVDGYILDAAVESDHPKEAVVALIVQQLVPSVGGLLAHALAGGMDPGREVSGGGEDQNPQGASKDSERRARLVEVRSQLLGAQFRNCRRARRVTLTCCPAWLAQMMMLQFDPGGGGDDDDAPGDSFVGTDRDGSDSDDDTESEAWDRPRPVATRQRMGALSQPLARHTQHPAKREGPQAGAPAWRPGGAAAAAARGFTESANLPHTPSRSRPWTPKSAAGSGRSDSWHVAECADRSAQRRRARLDKANERSVARESRAGFGSSTTRKTGAIPPQRSVPSHVLVTPPRPELTRPSRGIPAVLTATQSQKQRAFGSALSTHRGASGENLLPWQRRNCGPATAQLTTSTAEAMATEKSSTSNMHNERGGTRDDDDGLAERLAPVSVDVSTDVAVDSGTAAHHQQHVPPPVKRRKFLTALRDVNQDLSCDGLSFETGDLLVLTAKPHHTRWMGYVHGARSKSGVFPADSVRQMRSVLIQQDIAPGGLITVKLPKQAGTIDVVLPFGAPQGYTVAFAMPSPSLPPSDTTSGAAVRVAGEAISPLRPESTSRQGLQEGLEPEPEPEPEPLAASSPDEPPDSVGTAVITSGVLTVRLLGFRRMNAKGILEQEKIADLSARVLVGKTEKRTGTNRDVSFVIHETHAQTMIILLAGSNCTIDLSGAIRAGSSMTWYSLFEEHTGTSTERRQQSLIHVQLAFEPGPPSTTIGDQEEQSLLGQDNAMLPPIQESQQPSPTISDLDDDILGQQNTLAALADFCQHDGPNCPPVMCLTGPQGSGKNSLVKQFTRQWRDQTESLVFEVHVEMGSCFITSPRRLITMLCTEIIRAQPSLLPIDLTGDAKKLARTWLTLSTKLAAMQAIHGSVVFVIGGLDRMLMPPSTWFPRSSDIPAGAARSYLFISSFLLFISVIIYVHFRYIAGIRFIIPISVWLPSDICEEDICEEELPPLHPSASERLLRSVTHNEINIDVEDSILSMAASGSPLYTLLAGHVCVMTGIGGEDVFCDLAEMYRHCVQVAEKQLGGNTNLEACLSLLALSLSVGGPLYAIELDAMLEGTATDTDDAGRSGGCVKICAVEKTVLGGCFICRSANGSVTLRHDVIAAETCNMYDLLPGCPTESPPHGSKATVLHLSLGSAFHSQLLSAVSELKGAATPAAQAASKARVVRAAEMAVTHL